MSNEHKLLRHRRAAHLVDRQHTPDLDEPLVPTPSTTSKAEPSTKPETTAAATTTATTTSTSAQAAVTTTSQQTTTTSSTSTTETTASTTSETTNAQTTSSSTQVDPLSSLLDGVLGTTSATTTSTSTKATTQAGHPTTSPPSQPLTTPPSVSSGNPMSTFVQTVEASMSPTPSSAGSAAKEEDSTNVGVIVGAVAGGLLGLVLLGGIISFVLRRFNRRRIEREAGQFDEDAFRKSAVMIDDDAPNSLFNPRPPPTATAPSMSERSMGYGPSLYGNQAPTSPNPAYAPSYSDHHYPQSPPPVMHDAYYGGGQMMQTYDPMAQQYPQHTQYGYAEPSHVGYTDHSYTDHTNGGYTDPTQREFAPQPIQGEYPRMASVSEHAASVEETPYAARKSVTPFQADHYIDETVAQEGQKEATRASPPPMSPAIAGLPAALMPGGKR